MAPISFARGAPAPECLDPALIADCARAALERDGTTILSYGTGGGYGPLRELLAERHGVEPGRVFLTTGGLQGFVFYAAVQLAAPAGPRARRGPDLRPPAEDPRAGRAPRSWRCRWTTRASIPTRSRPSSRRGGDDLVPLHDPDLPEPERPHARRRPAPAARRARRRARPRRPRGRSRTASCATRASRRPRSTSSRAASSVTFTSSFSKTVAPGLRVGYFVVPEALRAAYDDRAVSTYISPPLLPQAIVHELYERGAFEPNLDADPRAPPGARGRDARRARARHARPARPGAGRRAATSSGSTSATASTRPSCSRGRPRPASTFVTRRRLLPAGARRASVGAPRVQLRDARADRRGRRAPRVAPLEPAIRPSSPRPATRCAPGAATLAEVSNSQPARKPTPSDHEQQDDERRLGREEDEVDR